MFARCWQVPSRCWQVLARCSECDCKVLAGCQQCTCRLKTPLRQSHSPHTYRPSLRLHTSHILTLASTLPASYQHLASTMPAAYTQQPVPRCRQNASRLQTAASTLQPAHRQQRTDNSQYLVAVKTTASTLQPARRQQRTDNSVGSVSGQSWVSVRPEYGQR